MTDEAAPVSDAQSPGIRPRVPLTWLYVPGDRPDRFEQASRSGADVVIVDLEDAVPAPVKAQARKDLVSWLASADSHNIEVRINAIGSPWAFEDLAALRDAPSLGSVRLPKVESGEDVATVADTLPGRVGIHCLIESARGVEAAFEIAAASSRVTGVGLGEADLRADLGISSPEGMGWVRSRLVVAARAAGLPAPAMAAYTDIADLEGLAASCRSGRALGMLGRSALHPRQLPVIVDAFLPDPEEVRRAEQVVTAATDAVDSGRGVFLLPSGQMVDAAVLAGARRILELAAKRNH